MKTERTYTHKEKDGEIVVSFNDLADQAWSSVLVRKNGTVVLVTVTASENIKDTDYFPLSVEYIERYYSIGAILGSRFMRRENRPSDQAILNGRIVDRTIRPLFDDSIRNEVQVVVTVLGIGTANPDVLGVLGASLALGTSAIPWRGPVSASRIARKNRGDEWETNPEYKLNDSYYDCEMLACGVEEGINMIELEAEEVEEKDVYDGLNIAFEEIKKLQAFQKEVINKEKMGKAHFPLQTTPQSVSALFNETMGAKIKDTIFGSQGKEGIGKAESEWMQVAEDRLSADELKFAERCFSDAVDEIVHKEAVVNKKRVDGRDMDSIRPLFAKAGGFAEAIHGTGIFYRGGTHVLTALTLGSPGDGLLLDTIEDQDTTKHFIHHYNFPPYSTGETGRFGGTNRRAIGHGALAEKALRPIIPDKEIFPYTIRLVSECMASNGSTSMGSVCASTLALMDGGVPIKSTVAGIAMGLMNYKDDYCILTDIQGPEDHYGDMDLKVAGSKVGITAIQMDVKVDSVSIKVLTETIDKARIAREKIIDVIHEEIPKPRTELSKDAPHIKSLKINPDLIGKVIGSGGKTIKAIKESSLADTIDVEDDGTIFISGTKEATEKASQKIESITHEYKEGEEFDGEVVSVTDFGAFVSIGAEAEGLVHVSEFAPERIDSPGKLVSVRDIVPVVIKEIKENNKISLSIKDRDPKFFAEKLENLPKVQTRPPALRQKKNYGNERRKKYQRK
ncbi:MAG: polyribonucleotide nucleotidyltransferase [Candidatus Campbellbacteria bacterium]|nr:polyribonucleotide nucleotidyltransferase [Candidatus Campbellbacteria bacterium]